jgi:hypothetical protein
MSFALSLFISVFILVVALAIVLTLVDNLFYSLQKRLSKRLIKPGRVAPPETQGFKGWLKKFGVAALYLLLIFCMAILPLMTNLKGTILNTNFVLEELHKLNLRAVVTELFQQDLTGIEPYKGVTVANTLNILEPWIESQADQTILAIYPYLLGQSDSLNVSLSLNMLKDTLRTNLEQSINESPPPEFLGYTQEQKYAYVNDLNNAYFGKIPADLQISSSISSAIPLVYIRNTITIIRLASVLLIPVIVLICVGIILLTRQVKVFTRKLGTSILLGGLLGFTYSYVLQLLGFLVASLSIISALQQWLIRVTVDVLAVVHGPGIWIICVGIAMLITSFLFGRTAVEKVENP